MSEKEDKISIEEEADNLIVVDPEDYHKTQKLKSIQESKEYYKSFIANESGKYKEMKESWSNPKEAFDAKRSEALALYASELLPIIEEAIEKGGLSEEDVQVETDRLVENLLDKSYLDIRFIADNRGRILVNGEAQALPESYQLRVYRQLERIERKLGFGLEIQTDKGPAEI